MRYEIGKEYNTPSSSIKENMETVRDHLYKKGKIRADIISDAAVTGIVHVKKGWMDLGMIFENNARQPEKVQLTVTTDTSLLPVEFSTKNFILQRFSKPPKKRKTGSGGRTGFGLWRIYLLFIVAMILTTIVLSISNSIRDYYSENKTATEIIFWVVIIGTVLIIVYLRSLVKKLKKELKEFMVFIIEEAGVAFDEKFKDEGDKRCWKCFTFIPAGSNFCPECRSKQK